jgi:hypothetical protein
MNFIQLIRDIPPPRPKFMVNLQTQGNYVRGRIPMVDSTLVQDISAISSELKPQSLDDDQDPIIQSCYELVCSGRPLSEILDEVKRLSDLRRGSKLDIGGRPGNAAVSEGADGPEPHSGALSEPSVAHLCDATLSPHRVLGLRQSPRTKIILLAAVFTLVSVFTYIEFSKAHPSSPEALLQSARDKGRELSRSLLPTLEGAVIGDLPQLGRQLDRFAGKVTTIKLLLAPVGGNGETFYYAGSWPVSALEAERQILASQGVLDRLPEICRAQTPFSLIYEQAVGGAEIIAVTPISTAVGCWAVVTTFSTDALSTSIRG